MSEGPEESFRLYSSSEVARRLGISSNLLRRYGLAWETLQGETLPHLPGLGRFYPEDVVESLEDAKAWLELRPEATVEDALRAVLGLQTAQAELSRLVQESVNRALAPLMAEVQSLRAQLHALGAQPEEVRREVEPVEAPVVEPAEVVEAEVVEEAGERPDWGAIEKPRKVEGGYTGEPWPAPWRVKKENPEADFNALEEDLEAEEEKDEQGFMGWFRRNF